MVDLRFELGPTDVLIRSLTDTREQWVSKHIACNATADSTVTAGLADAPKIERAAREDSLTVGVPAA